MAEVNVYYDTMGNTLTDWFGERSSEYLCEETGDEVILMKNQQGEVIGFEKLKYTIIENTNLKISLEIAPFGKLTNHCSQWNNPSW